MRLGLMSAFYAGTMRRFRHPSLQTGGSPRENILPLAVGPHPHRELTPMPSLGFQVLAQAWPQALLALVRLPAQPALPAWPAPVSALTPPLATDNPAKP